MAAQEIGGGCLSCQDEEDMALRMLLHRSFVWYQYSKVANTEYCKDRKGGLLSEKGRSLPMPVLTW